MNAVVDQERVIELEPMPAAHQVPMARQDQAIATQAPSPGNLLQIAVSRGAGLDELQKLMDLQERHERNEAKKAFDAAKAAFGAEHIVITKDKENKQFGSRYSSVGNLVNTTRPFLAKHGLAISWSPSQGDGLKVTCRLSHTQGHFEEASLSVPADTSGSKNLNQQLKSAITYAKITTFECVTGLVASDEGDDDGNGTGDGKKEKPIVKTALGAKRFEAALEAIRNGACGPEFVRERHNLTTDQDIALMDLEKELAK